MSSSLKMMVFISLSCTKERGRAAAGIVSILTNSADKRSKTINKEQSLQIFMLGRHFSCYIYEKKEDNGFDLLLCQS
jgi:hypothetical protein